MRTFLCAARVAAACLLMTSVTPATFAAPKGEASRFGRTVSEWAAQLQSEDAQTRFDALVHLAAIGRDAEAVLPAVARLTTDAHRQVRERAIGTLATLGPEGYKVIIRTLGSGDAAVRGICCDALTYGDPPKRAARAALLARLADEKQTVRFLAAFALTAVDPAALEPLPILREALRTTSVPAVTGACHAAARMGYAARPLLAPVLDVFQYVQEKALVAAAQALRAMGSSVRPEVLQRVAALDVNPRAQVVLLGVIADVSEGEARVTRDLAPFLRNANARVAQTAAEAIGRIGTILPSSLLALLEAARSPDGPSVAALEALALLQEVKDTRAAGLSAAREALVAGAGTAGFADALVALELPDPMWEGWMQLRRPPEAPAARARLLRVLVQYVAATDRPMVRAYAERSAIAAIRHGGGTEWNTWLDLFSYLLRKNHALAEQIPWGGLPEYRSMAVRGAVAESIAAGLEDPDPWHSVPGVDHNAGGWSEQSARTLIAQLDLAVSGSNVAAGEWARVALAYATAGSAPRLENALVVLASKQAALRRAAAAMLATLEPRTPEVVQALAAVVRNVNEEPVVRRTAAVALGRQGDAADAVITEALRTATGTSRRFWLIAWGRAGEPLAGLLPHVYEDLQSADNGVRDGAIEGLAAMGAHRPTAAVEIAKLLRRRSARDQEAGMRALSALAEAASPYAEEMVQLTIRRGRGQRALYGRLITEIGAPAVPGLVAALKTTEWEGRLVVLNILARIGSGARAALPALVSLLDDPDSSVREAALEVIEMIGAPRGSAPVSLVGALGDPVGRVRAGACRAAAARGPQLDAAERKALTRLADADDFPFVREAAAKALQAVR